jgi:ubiquinone/menaquinone biosynthesis C-methylase UbiE
MQPKSKEILSVRKKLFTDDFATERAVQQHKLVAQWINSLANETNSVLEIGCGSCYLKEHLRARYLGIDPIKHEDINEEDYFKIGSAESIPYANKSFDFVLIKDAINYFSDIEPVYAEASRVLNDQGVILITEMVGNNFHPITQVVKNFLKKYIGIKRNIWDSTYLNWYSIYSLSRAAKKFGFNQKFEYIRSHSRYYLILKKMGHL